MTQPNPTHKPVVHVVDDDASVRRALGRLLRSAGHDVESFASAEKFSTRDQSIGAGCIILDIRMQGMDGMTLQQQLAAEACPLPIVFLTGHGDIPMSVEAMKRGAEDFLTKPVDEDLLLAAVDRALERGRHQRVAFEEQTTIRSRVADLSPREFEVMRCLLTGALNKQIAAHLGIVEKTVKVHRARVLEKMGVHSVAELVHLCDQIRIEPEARMQSDP
jgi:FixJ family two-component response regulator